MKHAILLTVHDNASVVKTLFKMLDDERFTFYLLVDKKSRYLPSDYSSELKFSKVSVLPRSTLNWGGYSTIEGIVRLLETAFKDGADIFHYVQGSDLPLKTPDQMDAFFKKDLLYVDVEPNPNDFAGYKVLCKHWFADRKSFRGNKCLKFLDHALAHLYKPLARLRKMHGKMYTGSALWSISSEFAKYVLENKKNIKRMYQRSLAADEVFIQTLIMNSEFKHSLSEHGNARLIDWEHGEGNSPKTFTMKDLAEVSDAILNPSLMFIRKIHETRDAEIADHIFSTVQANASALRMRVE